MPSKIVIILGKFSETLRFINETTRKKKKRKK